MKSRSVIRVLVMVLLGATTYTQYRVYKLNRSIAWKRQLITDTYIATIDMYGCSSSITTAGHGGTPACIKACDEYDSIYTREHNPPAYVSMAADAVMDTKPDFSVCHDTTH